MFPHIKLWRTDIKALTCTDIKKNTAQLRRYSQKNMYLKYTSLICLPINQNSKVEQGNPIKSIS